MRVMTSGGREVNEGVDMSVKGRRWARRQEQWEGHKKEIKR